MATPPLSTLTDRVAPIEAGAEVVACAWLGRTPGLVLADGAVILAEIGEERRVTLHPDGAILAATSDRSAIVTGGDDGRVMRLAADGTVAELGNADGKWVDAVALSRLGRHRLVGRQGGLRPRRQGRRPHLGRPLRRARPRLHAEGLPPGGLALQRRDAVVPQRLGPA